MSKINKISILGIRSFDNVRSETIEFFAPLTLIVGLNGSGKTTIIECLKYATTGELPPGTGRGGPWISDPKLCGEREVLGQVKISFTSAQGLRMVATRNMSLTVKKTTSTFHAADCSLVASRGGEKLVTTSRLQDLNKMMPDYLGVSKAVLDNVIFCHQEESLWPLSASNDLKSRFDAIFEAVKYTKAIDNIKLLAKHHREALGLAKKDQEHTKYLKDQGAKVKAATERLWVEIEHLRAQADDKDKLSKEAATKAEAAFDKRNDAGEIVYRLNGKRGERDLMAKNLQRLQENLEEMSDSDQELQTMIDQYDERVKAYEADYESSKDRYRELEKTIKDTGSQVSSKERECGSYESQKEHYDQQVQNREKLIKEAARSHSIRGFDVDIDDQQVQAFMERINKMVRDQNAEFERVKQEIRDELAGIQDGLQQLNSQKTSLTQRKEGARQTAARNDSKISNLQGQLNKMNVDEGTLVAMQSSLQETQTKLDSAKSDAGSGDLESSIESLKAELRKLKDRKATLHAELVEGSRLAEETARLDLLRKDLKARHSSLETMIGAHGDKIKSVVGESWTPETLETRYQRSLDDSNTQVAEAEKQRDGTSRELQQVDYKLSDYRSDLKSKRAEVKRAEQTIRDAVSVEPSNYPEELRKMEESRDFVKADTDSYSQILDYLDACINAAEKHNGCRTCSRTFANDKEREKMISAVQKEKKKFESGKDAKNELADIEKELQAAKAAGSDFDAWERLTQKEIPALEKSEKELSDKRDQLLSQLEDQDTIVNDRQSAKREVQSLSKTVQTIANYSIDITNFEAQIEELLAKQKTAGLSRGLDAIQEDIKKVSEETQSVETRLDKSTGDRDRSKAYINSLELDKRDITSRLKTAEYQLKEKASLEGQIEEYKAGNAEQRETIKSCDNELGTVSDNLRQTQAKYDDASRRGDAKHSELQANVDKLKSSVNRLKLADDDIRAYIDKGGPQQLARGKRELQALKDEINRLEQEKRTIMVEVKALEDKLRSHSETRRAISDNQRYRHDCRELEATKAEIAELEEHNAEADHTYWEREGTKWQTERNKLNAEVSGIMGQLGSKDQDLLDKQQELDVEYKNAARKYKEAHIKVETTKACVEDLTRYGGALDKAIMKFHSIKMEEINRIIDELWRKTYQGTDVDTIIIRSEAESGASSKKTHNYRVCMVKQDTEMDMRGRCSAGQKVLACIIIRLALAECFGINCGLIALDEPTTNLDRDNIRALAESLGEIIKIRRKQKNFQLIVITHDEEFLRYMGCSDYTEYYWRVSRDERQKSVIQRQSIAEVM